MSADPYAEAWQAVGTWTPAASSPAAGSTAAGGTTAFAANESAVGEYSAQLGALVASYPATGYARWLDWVNVKCSYSGLVSIYYGAIQEPGRITSYGDGGVAEFDPNRPRYIPPGAQVFVVWTVPAAGHTASAVAGFREVTA